MDESIVLTVMSDEKIYDTSKLVEPNKINVVDMSHVRACPSMLIAALLTNRDRVVLHSLSPSVMATIKLLRLDMVLMICRTVGEAMVKAQRIAAVAPQK